MVEEIFKLSVPSNEKVVKNVISNEDFNYLQIVLNKGDKLAKYLSNANTYITVVRGTLSISLDKQELHQYNTGILLKIPINTKIDMKNLHDDVLELIVIKVPVS